MAKVEKTKVKRQVVTTVEDDVVVLTLSKNEAETIYTIISNGVTGNTDRSRRKYTDALFYAFRKAGVVCPAANFTGQIHFKDEFVGGEN